MRWVMHELGVAEPQAETMIGRSDAERAGFHRFFFGRSWDDSGSYDLTFNGGRLGNNCIMDIIRRTVEELNQPDILERTRVELDDLFLEQEVISQIVYRDRIPVQNLEVACKRGELFLRGMVMIEEHIRLVTESAEKVNGVTSVRSEVYFIPSYTYVMR